MTMEVPRRTGRRRTARLPGEASGRLKTGYQFVEPETCGHGFHHGLMR
jgi:hypothetical protein